MNGKTGIVDVGGGMRGIYAAGVMDYCLDHDIYFDLGVGVSAGSANLASFIANQPRRNLQFYTEYAMRKEYMGVSNFLRTGSFIGLDYVYGTLSNHDGESPLDYSSMEASSTEFMVVATKADTGEAQYFTKLDICQDHYDVFKASSAIPFVCKPYVIDGIPYYDGALADPVPVETAFQSGCEKVVLVLTLPADHQRSSGKDIKLANRIRKQYPQAAEQLKNRANHYNAGVAMARRYAKEGRLLIVAPDDTCGVGTLTRDKDALLKLYAKGYQDGEKVTQFLK